MRDAVHRVRFADGFDRPETLALGLGAPQLGIVVATGAVAYLLLQSPAPAPLRIPLATVLAGLGAAVGWGRLAGRPLMEWAWLAARFLTSPRRGPADDESSSTTPVGEWRSDPMAWPFGNSPPGSPRALAQPPPAESTPQTSQTSPLIVAAAPHEPPGETNSRTSGPELDAGDSVDPGEAGPPAGHPLGGHDPDAAEPPWARWLREGGIGGTSAPASNGRLDGRPGASPSSGLSVPARPQAPEPDGDGRGAGDWSAHSHRRRQGTGSGDRLVPGPEPPGPDAGHPLDTAVDRRTGHPIGHPTDGPTDHPTETATDRPTDRPRSALAGRLRAALRGRTSPTQPKKEPPEERNAEDPFSWGARRGAAPPVEIDRVPLVLLPEPLERRGADSDQGEAGKPTVDGPGAGDARAASRAAFEDDFVAGAVDVDDLPPGVLEIDDASPVVIPLPGTAHAHRPRTTEADRREVAEPEVGEPHPASVAPPFLGATRRVAFFSLNGGSGKTTLATEVAGLLAAQGRFRPHPDSPPRELRVVLLDLDLRSANVAVRLGIPQPTLLDYLIRRSRGENAERDGLEECLVRHPSGLRALLGPPKPLTAEGGIDSATVSEIIGGLESRGTHFLIVDTPSALDPVTTWVLGQCHDIFVVVRPTASGVQDAYRTTEVLRRHGLGPRLRYVVNRARQPLDLSEVMADLGGHVAVTIPDDHRIDAAENAHRLVTVEGSGPAAQAIRTLAATLHPGLATPVMRRRGFGRLGRRRVG